MVLYYKKVLIYGLALIEVKILLCRGSAQKIATKSRKQLLKKLFLKFK